MPTRHAPASGRPADVARHYLSDLVYGASDGLITTFAIVSGTAGAGWSPGIAVVLGLVNLAADGFSMGASSFLAIRTGAAVEGRDRGVREPLLHGAATCAAFVVVGSAPLLAWLVPGLRGSFVASAVVTAVAMFAAGAARSWVLPNGWLRCGLEMLLVGCLAGACAYGAGAVAVAWTAAAD